VLAEIGSQQTSLIQEFLQALPVVSSSTFLRPNAFIRKYRRNAPYGFLFEIKRDRIYSRFVTLCEPSYVVFNKTQFRVLHSFVLSGH